MKNEILSEIFSIVVFLAFVGLFIWFGYVNYGWFGFLNWGWWGWFQQSESELLIERCELLLERIEEFRFLAEAAYSEKVWDFNKEAAILVDDFKRVGCLNR